jgi:Na+/phosphate symporter
VLKNILSVAAYPPARSVKFCQALVEVISMVIIRCTLSSLSAIAKALRAIGNTLAASFPIDIKALRAIAAIFFSSWLLHSSNSPQGINSNSQARSEAATHRLL